MTHELESNQVKSVLLCTVGGSHEPIIKAVKSSRPDHVCFFCTDRDPASGRKGSREQIEGKGSVIKAKPSDEKRTLPNIPTQLQLESSQFSICLVPADDLDDAVARMRQTASDLGGRFPEAEFIADYTGGTKTMSAALVCLALEWEELNLKLVKGTRASLEKVKPGTEKTVSASITRLRQRRRMVASLKAWQRYAYQEAEEGLKAIQISADSPEGNQISFAGDISSALACWDIFDHHRALKLLEDYGGCLGKAWPTMLRDLCILTDMQKPQRAPLLIIDLWHNAERRASQGRFDDAVARLYRLIEWTAQWQLRTRYDINTADVPADKLPKSINITAGADGKIKLGLWHSWQVAAQLDETMTSVVDDSSGRELRDLLDIRNQSILAHGDKPVNEQDWQRMCQWMESRFFPVFDQLAREAGLQEKPGQLPRELPDLVLEGLDT